MRKLLFLAFLFSTSLIYAGKSDSLFQRHQLVVEESDGMSHLFADGPSGPTIHTVFTTPYEYSRTTDTKYLPNYVLHIHFKYSLGLTRYVRLETGLGYMFEGLTISAKYTEPGFEPNVGSYNGYIFTRKFTVPLYVKFIKPVGAGAFTCTVGPEFTLPVNSFIKEHNYLHNGMPMPNTTVRDRYTSRQTFYESSMGINLKMGYQKYFRYSTVDVGPVVNFSDFVLLDKGLSQEYRASGYRPYHYYIGVDVGVYFGVKKKVK